MLGLGWSEMLVLAVVVLIVVGPKDLPVMLRNLGRMMGTVRRMSNEFRREIDKAIAIDEVKEAKRSITEPLRQTSQDINREFNAIRSGKVEPTGKLKPSEPGKESVADEIRARAGLAPAKVDAGASESSEAPAKTRAAARPARATALAKATTSKTASPAKSSKPVASGGKAQSSTTGSSRGRATKASGSSSTKAKAATAASSSGTQPGREAKRPVARRKTSTRKATPAKAETAVSTGSGED